MKSFKVAYKIKLLFIILPLHALNNSCSTFEKVLKPFWSNRLWMLITARSKHSKNTRLYSFLGDAANSAGAIPSSNHRGVFCFLASNGSSVSNWILIFSTFCQNSSKSFSVRKPSRVITVSIAISCPSTLDSFGCCSV